MKRAPHFCEFSQGFTLLEMLLSVALMAFIVGIGSPLYYHMYTRADSDTSVMTIVHLVREAQIRARGIDGDTPWGVQVGGEQATLFRGDSYVSRNAAFDLVAPYNVLLTPTGLTEIVFEPLTGYTGTVGTLTLTTNDGTARTLIINEQGMINY